MQLGKCKSTPERQAFILDLVCKIEKSQLVLLKISQRLGVDCLSEDNRLDMYLQLIQQFSESIREGAERQKGLFRENRLTDYYQLG